jgi:2-haloacid dehalogenase
MPAPARRPSVLVFDVNETLIDIESLAPQFERLFGDGRVLREWFAQLILYSMTLTVSGTYVRFPSLAQAVLRMTADVHHVDVDEQDLEALTEGLRNMPPHPDVEDGLRTLLDQGYRLVTLTNSPPTADGTPLEKAGLAGYFERRFSVDEWRVYKPSSRVYTEVAAELGVASSECMMVAAHAWDTIGAQSVGFTGALITRPGNASLSLTTVPQPDVVATDLIELAERLDPAGLR